MNSMQHILIVDDHEDIRDLVKRFLEQHGFLATAAKDGAEMRILMNEEEFQLIVLDLMMPGEDGFSICKSLRASGNNIPIIMLTAMNEDTDMIVGLELGADDYLTKPFNPRELLARIKAVLRRTELSNESSSDTIKKNKTIKHYYFEEWTLDLTKRELKDKSNTIITLSTAEFQLLLTFLQHPQKTLSRDQLLDLARGRGSQVFDRSIDTLISRLRRKLKPENSELIKTVWGGGYCFIGDVTNDLS